MTCMNITIGHDRRFAIVSADTIIATDRGATVDSAVTSNHAAAARATFVGKGAAPKVEPIGFMSKITAVPHLHLVTCGTGLAAAVAEFGSILSATPPNIAHIGDAADYASAMLPGIAARHPEHPFTVAAVGWNPRARRVEAFAWLSAGGFARVEIGPGHTMTPAVDADDAAYGELYESWGPALHGWGAERFHRLLLANQYRAFCAGKFAEGVAIGGRIIYGRVECSGICLNLI